MAEADKSNNGLDASAVTEVGQRVKDFPIVRPGSISPIDRPIARPTNLLRLFLLLLHVPWNRLILPGANFVIGGELAELVGEARTLIMLSRY